MLDPRLYRVAFVPVLLALMVAAFSLQDQPRGVGTTLTSDAFDATAAMTQLDDLAQRYPDRRPGSEGDDRLAAEIAAVLRQEVPGTVEEHRYSAETIDGKRNLVDVVATRPGAPGPGLVVVAHRDAAGTGAKAELSATATLLELAGIAADGRLRRTITFISTSGGSGGFAGAREEAQRLGGRADAVLVLGDVSAAPGRRPFVVGFSDGLGQAPLQLRRTVEAAVRREVGTDAGGPHLPTQWARFAVPVTISEQGPFLRAGQPAVLLSATGERPPAADAGVNQFRLRRFGRAALRVLYALDDFRDLAQPPSDDLTIRGKVLPAWAVRIIVGTLLVPPLLVGVDAFARLRRRHERFTGWAVWVLASSIPFLVACLFAVLLALVGLLHAPAAPSPPAALHVGVGAIAATIAIALVFVLGWIVLRPALLRAAGVAGRPDTPAAAVAVALVTGVVAVALWVGNPYAAGLAVPAAHLWLWATAPNLRLPRPGALAAVVAALLPLAVVALLDARDFGLGGVTFGWFWTLIVAGGQIPIGSWVLWSMLWGCGVAAALVALRRRQEPEVSGPGDVTVRGPITYAGPGSLGGTESALRR